MTPARQAALERVAEAARALARHARNLGAKSKTDAWTDFRVAISVVEAALSALPAEEAPTDARPTPEQDAADLALTEAGADLARTVALGEAIGVAEKWAATYPVDIWPVGGVSLDAKAAGHGRHVAKMIADDLRKLLDAPPSGGRGADEGGAKP